MDPTYISVFDIFKIGIGPSSSHTLGPWKAALDWITGIPDLSVTSNLNIKVHLYGSLALTGKGHCTDKAIIAGLSGLDPETVDQGHLEKTIFFTEESGKILIAGKYTVDFVPAKQIVFHKDESLPFHPNALKFEGEPLIKPEIYYSTGGGFIVRDGEKTVTAEPKKLSYYYSNSKELADICAAEKLDISAVAMANEKIFRTEEEVSERLLNIWKVMKEAAFQGCHTEGMLPGGLGVKRRASGLNRQLIRVSGYQGVDEWIEAMKVGRDFRKVIARVSCLAIAVNEVNASMGRVVTAPTNGSSGVIPAVLFYYLCFSGRDTGARDIIRFLLTASEIGKFFKQGATLSAAAGGCQAEIGVSSAMAAAGLTECLGGSPDQALMAAEIAAEHHLGLTCDPVGGLVQIPCIERNSMGAVKAITAAVIALASDPASAKVSLDTVIDTLKETAEGMNEKFKETSLGGLAVNVSVNIPEC